MRITDFRLTRLRFLRDRVIGDSQVKIDEVNAGHPQLTPVTAVMRVGWCATTRSIPVSLGNTFLELGVNMAVALPGVEWLEYSSRTTIISSRSRSRFATGMRMRRSGRGMGWC